ncbi:metallophosphoesterase [Microvirga sp. 3-52]|uniref:metallophosphoesterase family protein n=1 Tax=Microvirga sp. 3-52 TaxID=2792425 RepID=UPI001ACFC6CA|nr:metallophosphoesterase [Microvirga sp. 3-52]MBO1906165.1 metallophosphoesterase [Microvirga sp. 3-52]MBS7453451.1 metallophosphoesterase [Microvirga sp. 3-52]
MILSGDRLPPIACNGVLVIGDPHVGSRRPGRRKDVVWPQAVLGKLERCVAIANERQLAVVILGDLFDRPVETDVALKNQLVRVLKGFRHRPIVNVGNHDIQHTTLTDSDSLALLGLCDVVDVVATSAPVTEFQIGARRIGVGMTPYGQAIPTDARGSFTGVDLHAWFTHHDIAFDGGYPGAVPPFAVEGCDVLVNGHIHKTQKSVLAGRTRWMNPGNITRQSVDLVDHVPRAWILDGSGALEPQALPFESNVFDLTGRVVDAADGDAVARQVESAFVTLLQAESSTELKRSGDGSIIRDEIEAKFTDDDTSEAVRAIVRSLLSEAVERHAAQS